MSAHTGLLCQGVEGLLSVGQDSPLGQDGSVDRSLQQMPVTVFSVLRGEEPPIVLKI